MGPIASAFEGAPVPNDASGLIGVLSEADLLDTEAPLVESHALPRTQR